MSDDRDWAHWPWKRCLARRERRGSAPYWGRCELRQGHEGNHAFERLTATDVTFLPNGHNARYNFAAGWNEALNGGNE